MLSKFTITLVCVLVWGIGISLFVCQRAYAQVMINEVMPDPQTTSDKSEWIELYNYSDTSVDLSDWDIDGKTFAASALNVVDAGQLLIVTKDISAFTTEFGALTNLVPLDISLSNAGDTVKLSHAGTLIDQLIYTSSTPSKSWERRSVDCNLLDLNPDGDSLNQLNPNQGKACTELPPDPPPTVVQPTTLQISEVFPSPDTSLGEKEWLELYNYSVEAVDIKDWKLQDSTKTMTLPDITISPNSHMLISNLKISLNNSGETILLISPTGQTIDSFIYGNTPKQQSQIRVLDSDRYSQEIKLTLSPTPNAINVFTPQPPKVVVPKTTVSSNTSSVSTAASTSENIVKSVKVWSMPNTDIVQTSNDAVEVESVLLQIPAWQIFGLTCGLIAVVFAWRTGLLASYIKWWQAG